MLKPHHKIMIARWFVAALVIILVALIATSIKASKNQSVQSSTAIEAEVADMPIERPEVPDANLLSDDSGHGDVTKEELVGQQGEQVVDESVVDNTGYLPAETTYSEPVLEPYSDISWFKSAGVVYQNGQRVTWYNPARLGISYQTLCANTLGATAQLRGDGVVTVNGYIAVAMPSNYSYGTIVDTPFGVGIVADHSGGAMDIMTGW